MCISASVSKCICVFKFMWPVYSTLLMMCLYPLVSCINGSMRLVGPDGPNVVEGRVEYCSNGLWGTVSDNGFDSRDGEVVCRRLGYQHPSKTHQNHVQHVCQGVLSAYMSHIGVQLFDSSYYGRGTGPIVLSSLSCNGTESKLEDCSYSSSYYDYHSKDIGLHCYERGGLK